MKKKEGSENTRLESRRAEERERIREIAESATVMKPHEWRNIYEVRVEYMGKELLGVGCNEHMSRQSIIRQMWSLYSRRRKR